MSEMKADSVSQEERERQESGEGKRVIENMGMLDLRSAKDIEGLRNVTAIRNVGAIIIPEELAGILAGIPMENVGSVIPIPQGTNVSLQMGQIRLTGEALAAGPEDTILVLVGQIFVTSQVEKVGYKEIRLTGQLIAPRGSETALGAKMTQMTGQTMYYPWTGPSQDLRVLLGDESISREFLELLEHPTVLVAVGDITFKEDITPDLLKTKVPAMMSVGDVWAPKPLLPLVQALAVEKVGSITGYPPGARFYKGKDTLNKEYFEYLPEPIAMAISGKVTLTEDVTVELIRSKVREIVLRGRLVAPKALLPLLRALMSEKTGKLQSLEEAQSEE